MVFIYRYFGCLRFLLALLVMLQHFAANAAPYNFTRLIQPYEPGSIAVLVFFCLSGFVIAEAIDVVYRAKPAAFLTNRALRIVPHFLIALTISICLQKYFADTGTLQVERNAPLPPDSAFSAQNIFFNYVSLIPALDRQMVYKFLSIAWAVRIEITFYLVMAICLFADRYSARWKTINFGAAAMAMLIVLIPLFILSVLHRVPPMFGFLPYFSYGMGVYYALTQRRLGVLIALLSVLGIVCHFLSLPPLHPMLGFARNIYGEFMLLGALILIMTLLAQLRGQRHRRIDGAIGDITYPLYLYHYDILVYITSIGLQYSYSMFFWGMLISIAFSTAMARMIDPVILVWRNRIRGRAIK